MASSNEPSGWYGWVLFAAVLMVITGVFQSLAGLLALINDEHVLVTKESLYLFDVTTWGWIHFVVGVIVALAGFAVARGDMWGRVVAVILASVSAVANMAFISTNPIWSIFIIVVNLLVIYAVIIHGGEIKKS